MFASALINRLILVCLLTSALFGKELSQPSRYLAIGFLDHKTGTSLVGFAKTLWQNDRHEVFIGGGTLVAMFTASFGWKYYFNHKVFQLYSVVAIQGVSSMGGMFNAPFISFGAEKRLWKKLYINGGMNSTIRPHPEKSLEFVNLPTLNLNYRY